MKIVDRIVVGNNLDGEQRRTVRALRKQVEVAILGVDHPRGTGALAICPRVDSKHFPNGLGTLKKPFEEVMKGYDWIREYRWPKVQRAISGKTHSRRVRRGNVRQVRRGNAPGPIDHFKALDGLRLGVEWEFGYVGSPHRSINRLLRGITEGVIDGGILIVPDRALQMHCTNRSANFEELEGYLDLWSDIIARLGRGYLEVIVVSYDRLDTGVPYLKKQRKSGGESDGPSDTASGAASEPVEHTDLPTAAVQELLPRAMRQSASTRGLSGTAAIA